MVKAASMEFNWLTRQFVACKCKFEQLRQIALHQSISSFHQISHLEVVLNLYHYRHKVLVHLSLFQYEVVKGWCLKERNELSHEVAYISYPWFLTFKERVSDWGEMGQTGSCFYLDRCWLLVPNLCCEDLEKTCYSLWVFYESSPTWGNLSLRWVIQHALIHQDRCKIVW